jgi:hypothetical protein
MLRLVEVVGPVGQTSNPEPLLETLEEWNRYLKENAPSFRNSDPEPSP